MKRKGRLPTGQGSMKDRSRLAPVKNGDMSLNSALDDLSRDLKEGFVAMGGKEAIYNLDDDGLKDNIKLARQMIQSHPEAHLLLKVELEEEPEQGAGRFMFTRAEDFVHFDRIEVEDVDSGMVYTVPRRSINKIIGRVLLESNPEFVDEGYGVDRNATQVQDTTGEAVSGQLRQ